MYVLFLACQLCLVKFLCVCVCSYVVMSLFESGMRYNKLVSQSASLKASAIPPVVTDVSTLSVSHSCTMLRPLDRMRCHLVEKNFLHLVPSNTVLNGVPVPTGRGDLGVSTPSLQRCYLSLNFFACCFLNECAQLPKHIHICVLPSVLWQWWLDNRKGIWL